MKRIIGWVLITLFFAAIYAGIATAYAVSGCHWAVVVFVPLAPFVCAALFIAFCQLVAWLLD